MPRLDRTALAALLSEQDGVVTRKQLIEKGVDPEAADRRLVSARWVRLLPQVYLAAPGPATPRQHARAALLYGGPDTALTGRVACRAWGLRDVPDGGGLELLLPHARRLVGGPGVRLRRTRRTLRQHEADGLRVTGPAPAVLHAATDGMPLQDIRALVLAALADGRTSLSRLAEELDALPQAAGTRLVRRALRDGAAGCASAPEAEALDLLGPWARQRGLPLVVNAEVLLHGRLLGVVDDYLPTVAVGLEIDSRRHHASLGDLDTTLRRHARFTQAGVCLLHVTPQRLRLEPQQVLHELEQAVTHAGPVPLGLELRYRAVA